MRHKTNTLPRWFLDLFFFQDAFSDIALFFHDFYGGDLIGIVWKPQSFVSAPFKVQGVFGVFYPSVLVEIDS